MTINLKSNDLNDIHIDAEGNFVIVEGIDAVLQSCEEVARSFLGEMIYAKSLGVNTRTSLFEGNPSVISFDPSLRRNIIRVDGVVSIRDLSVTPPDSEQYIVKYNMIIVTEFGEAFLNGSI